MKSKEFLKHPEGSVFQNGYGQLPRMVMCDPELSLIAKVIYAYIASYAGGGDQAFPSIARICNDLAINKDTFYKHFKKVEDAGYITRVKTMTEGNKFSNNIYQLNFIIEKKDAINSITPF